jgi:threonine dehydrogenase-like Zn-dependent dehydrogenase
VAERRTDDGRRNAMKITRCVLEGRITPGRVFDRVTDLDGVPDGYRAMDAREAIKVLIEF